MKGVYKSGKRWSVTINNMYLGTYATEEDGIQALMKVVESNPIYAKLLQNKTKRGKKNNGTGPIN
jgi:hypothetical protein